MAPPLFPEENKRKALPSSQAVFEESGLAFLFYCPPWRVVRYDRHAYFARLSGAGLKGVDFVGIYREEELVLIEVKNYQTDNEGLRKADIEASLSQPSLLADNLAAKIEDTLQAIRVIHTFLSRKWLYRLWRLVFSRLPDVAPEWYFWRRCYQLAEAGEVRLMCWMETDEAHQSLLPEIERGANAVLNSLPGAVRILPFSENPFSPDLVLSPV